MTDPRPMRTLAVVMAIAVMSACDDDEQITAPPELPPAVDVASVTVKPDRVAIEVGDSVQYTATVLDSRGAAVDIAVVWSLSSTVAGTISSTGLFIAAAEGSTMVVATVPGTTRSATSDLAVVSEGEIVISDDAVVLDSTKWILISTSAEHAVGRYRFEIVAAGGAMRGRTDTTRVRVGDHIVGGHGYGYLRTVEQVSYQGNTVTLETSQAALTDVVLKGDFLHAFAVNDPGGSSSGLLRVGPTVLETPSLAAQRALAGGPVPLDGVDFLKREICFDPPKSPEICFEVGFEVTDGEVRFRPDVDLGGKIGGGALEEFHIGASGVLNLDAALEFSMSLKAGYGIPDSVKVKADSAEKFVNRELFQASTPFSFFIGYLPVFGRIIFNISLEAEATAGIEATWTTGVHIEYGVSGGLKWDGTGWSRSAPLVPQPSYSEDEFEFDGVKGVGEMQMSVVPELNLELYGVAGPFIEVEPYAKVAGEVDILTLDANAQLLLGTDLNVGFKTNDDVKDLTGIGLEYTALSIPLFRERKAIEIFTNNPLYVYVDASAMNGDAADLPTRGYDLEMGPSDPDNVDTAWWNLFHLDLGCRTVFGAPGPFRFWNAVCAPEIEFLAPGAGAEAVYDRIRTGLEHRLDIDKGGARNCAWVDEDLTNPYYREVSDDSIVVPAGPRQRTERRFELECVAWGQLDVSVTATGDPADYASGFVLYTGDLTTIEDDAGAESASPADPFTRTFYQDELRGQVMFGGPIQSGETRSYQAIFSSFAVLEVPTNCNVLDHASRQYAYFDSVYVASEQVARVHFDVTCDPLPDLTFTTVTTCDDPGQPCFMDTTGYELVLNRPGSPIQGWGDRNRPRRSTPTHFTPAGHFRADMGGQDTVVIAHAYPHDEWEVVLDDVARSCRVESGFMDSDHGNVGRWSGTTRLGTRSDGSDASLDIAVVCNGYPPQGVMAKAVSDVAVEVTWNRTDRPEIGGVAGHRVYRNGMAVSGLVPPGTEEFPQTDSFVDDGLIPDRIYTYTVVMEATDGRRSASSPDVTATTDTAPTRPAAPAGLRAVAQSQTGIRLTWADRSSNESHFRLEMSQDSISWAVAANPGRNIESHAQGGLAPGTTYWFRIRAENTDTASAWSNVASATTHTPPVTPTAPQAPTSLTVSQPGGTRDALLQWTDNADNEDDYRIERSGTGGATWIEIAVLGPNATSHVDTPPNEPVYTYRVRACNAVGCSAYSNTASITFTDPLGLLDRPR